MAPSPPSQPSSPAAVAYDGLSEFADDPDAVPGGPLRVAVTIALVTIPVAGLVAAATLAWGSLFAATDLVLALVLYLVTGFGISVGFHRGLTHRGYTMRRPLRVIATAAASMAFEGSAIDWVATHRRHHAFTDRPGDPHSPYRYGTSAWGQVRGLAYAHVGWLFSGESTSAERYAPDLLADPDIRRLSRAFPLFCVVSLALPFAIGLAITGTFWGGFTAFLWAGLARVALLQHVTWSINSLCHMFGSRPHATRRFDRSTNLWPLALVSFGESWHNGHHSAPSCARHGRGSWQLDPTAGLIRGFERLRLVSDVRWTARGLHADASARTAGPPAP